MFSFFCFLGGFFRFLGFSHFFSFLFASGEDSVFSANFQAVAVYCPSVFGHGENCKKLEEGEFRSDPVYTDPVRNLPNFRSNYVLQTICISCKALSSPHRGIALAMMPASWPTLQWISATIVQIEVNMHRITKVLSGSPKPHPSKPHPCNMPQAKTEVALRFSECCAAEVALQQSLFCSAEVICTKSCTAASENCTATSKSCVARKWRFPAAFLRISSSHV